MFRRNPIHRYSLTTFANCSSLSLSNSSPVKAKEPSLKNPTLAMATAVFLWSPVITLFIPASAFGNRLFHFFLGGSIIKQSTAKVSSRSISVASSSAAAYPACDRQPPKPQRGVSQIAVYGKYFFLSLSVRARALPFSFNCRAITKISGAPFTKATNLSFYLFARFLVIFLRSESKGFLARKETLSSSLSFHKLTFAAALKSAPSVGSPIILYPPLFFCTARRYIITAHCSAFM